MAIAALDALGAALAEEEAGHGVRVNIVAPGQVASENAARRAGVKLGMQDVQTLRYPFGRLPRPSDLARIVRFLVSEDASFVTGQRIVVGGEAVGPAPSQSRADSR
jgi:3-oxoacyl-[acyl-carrier protein] reductase